MYSQKIYLIFIDLTLFTFCFFKLELERKKKRKENKNIDSTVLAFFFFKLIYCVFSSHTCFIYQTPKLYKRRPLGFTEKAANSVETLVSCSIICPVDVTMSVFLESSGNPMRALRGR